VNPSEKKWLVFYTKSRHEKKVEELLEKRGVEVYLPMQKIIRQWSDRKKKVEVPLFNSYIFVFEVEAKIPEILSIPGIAWNIRHNDKPAQLRTKELDLIRRFVNTGLFIETYSIDNLQEGDQVEILDGPLKGISGVLTHADEGGKFSVALAIIGQVIQVKIDKWMLKRQN
jgi:transcription termination/antitermination protein NusG